jgi:hypothetical protein
MYGMADCRRSLTRSAARRYTAGPQQRLAEYPTNFSDRPPIPVWVRIVWDEDGEEWCAGEADRWNPWFVRVRFAYDEPRAIQGLTWIEPRDVHSRAVPADT